MANDSIIQDDKEVPRGNYELSFMITTPEEESRIQELLKKLGAQMHFTRAAQKISLAYPIKKQTNGFFGFSDFSMDRDQAATLRKELSLMTGVLRFLILDWSPEQVRENQKAYERRGARSTETTAATPTPTTQMPNTLTNEALEAKIQEMLKD